MESEIVGTKPTAQPVKLDQKHLIKTTIKPKSITGEELLKMKVEKMDFLIEGIMQRVGLVAIAGSSDVGKSTFLRQLATSIVLDKPEFLGFRINAKYKSVLYISTEDDKEAIAFLLNKQKDEEVAKEKYKNLRFIFDSSDLVNKIDNELKTNPADCVIIDAFTDIYEGEMNAVNKVRHFLNRFSILANQHNCLFIFLHHTGKRTEMLPPSKDNLLGSQGFEGKMRLVIELRKDNSTPSKRHLCIVKGNYITEEFKKESYVLEFTEKMIFIKTAERKPFSTLLSPAFKKADNTKAKEKAILYKTKDNLSIRKIREKLKSEDLHYSKSVIAEWVKDCPSSEISKEKMDTGQKTQEK